MSQVHLIKHGDKLLARVDERDDGTITMSVTDKPMTASDLLEIGSYVEELANRLVHDEIGRELHP